MGSWFVGGEASLGIDFPFLFGSVEVFIFLFLIDVIEDIGLRRWWIKAFALVSLAQIGFGQAFTPFCTSIAGFASWVVFASLNQNDKFFIPLLDIIDKLIKLVSLDGQELWHIYQILDFFVVVSMIEELIKSITFLLSFSNEKKEMVHLLVAGIFDRIDREVSHRLDVVIVGDDVWKVHSEETQDFLVFDVVSSHFVEGILGSEDVVDQIEDDESNVKKFDNIWCFWP